MLTGTAAPTASDGVDGDLFVQDDTRTYLGVTSTTLTFWKKVAGTWAKVGNNVGGSKWYVNNTSSSSADTKPGDMLLRTDTGDIWQRGTSGWGTAIGNLKGPKGDTGSQGPKGDAGSVNTVNGKAGPTVVLSAADVQAIATAARGVADGVASLDASGKVPADQLPPIGGAVSSVNGETGAVNVTAAKVGAIPVTGAIEDVNTVIKGNGTNSPFLIYGNGVDATRFGVTASGAIYSNSHGNTLYNVGIGDTGTSFGGGQYMLAMKNAAVLPTSNPASGSLIYSWGGVPTVRESNGAVYTMTPSNEFEPEDLGLKAWAYDPAVSHSTPMYCGTTPRLAAVKIKRHTSVSKIVWHFGGYAGGLTSGSWASIYSASSLAPVGHATSIEAGNEPAEQHGKGGLASATALDAAVTLAPGVYYVVWRFNYNTTTGDGPMILGVENSFGGPANQMGLNNLWRYGRLSTTPATAPPSLTGLIANESNRFWVALA